MYEIVAHPYNCGPRNLRIGIAYLFGNMIGRLSDYLQASDNIALLVLICQEHLVRHAIHRPMYALHGLQDMKQPLGVFH